MSSILDLPAVRELALRVTVEQYHRLGAAGILNTDTELLSGVIVNKMMKSPLHTWTVQRLAGWLRDVVGPGMHVRQEQPLTLADSEPEPDLAVVSGGVDDYRDIHPRTAELVIEVAVGSVALDRTKAELYAAAGIPEYWLVLPDERAVEVYGEPGPTAYLRHERVEPPQSIGAACISGRALQLADLFST
jgi:Uma2 family endonuclease